MTKTSLYHYGLLALPLSFAGLPLYLHIPDLYATEYGLSLATIGMLLLAIRLFDAFQDPIIGILTKDLKSDKSKLGRVVIFVCFMMAIGMYFLISPQGILPTYIWFAVFMLVCTSAFSILTIIYQSIGAVWKEGYHERTQITTTREAIGLIGVTLAALLPSVLMQFYPAQEAFQIYAIIFAGLIISVALVWLRWLKTVEFESLVSAKPTKFNFFKAKSTRPLFVIWFMSQLSSAIPVVLVIFFIRDNLELEQLTGLFLLIYFLSGVMGMPLWNQVQKLWGKQKAWQIAMFLAVASFAWAYLLQSGDAVGYTFVCVFSGLALGAELAIPPSILADRISKEGAEHEATKFFGVSTFLGKFALALASGIVLPLLAYWEYSPSQSNSDAAVNSLIFSYALLPCLIKLAAAISLSFIKLEGEVNVQNKESY